MGCRRLKASGGWRGPDASDHFHVTPYLVRFRHSLELICRTTLDSSQSITNYIGVGSGPITVGTTLSFSAPPVLRDGSGSYKRLPHQVQWEHLQVGDLLVAVRIGDGPSGQSVLDILQFWAVLRIEGDSFEVEINNVVGMSGGGDYVYRKMAELVDFADEEP